MHGLSINTSSPGRRSLRRRMSESLTSPSPTSELTPLSALTGHRKLNSYESEKIRHDHERWKARSRVWVSHIINESLPPPPHSEEPTHAPSRKKDNSESDSKWDEFRDALFGSSTPQNQHKQSQQDAHTAAPKSHQTTQHDHHSYPTHTPDSPEFPTFAEDQDTNFSHWNKNSFLQHNNTSPASPLYSQIERDEIPLYKTPWKRKQSSSTSNTATSIQSHQDPQSPVQSAHSYNTSVQSSIVVPSHMHTPPSVAPKTPRAHHTVADTVSPSRATEASQPQRHNTNRRDEAQYISRPPVNSRSQTHAPSNDADQVIHEQHEESSSKHWMHKPSSRSTSKRSARPEQTKTRVYSRKQINQETKASAKNSERAHHYGEVEAKPPIVFEESASDDEPTVHEVEVPGFSRKLRTDANGSVIVKRSESMWQTLRQEWGTAPSNSRLTSHPSVMDDSSSSSDDDTFTPSGRIVQHGSSEPNIVKRNESIRGSIRKESTEESNTADLSSPERPVSSLVRVNSVSERKSPSETQSFVPRSSSPSDLLRNKVKERISNRLPLNASADTNWHNSMADQPHSKARSPERRDTELEQRHQHNEDKTGREVLSPHFTRRKRPESVAEFLERLKQGSRTSVVSPAPNSRVSHRPFTRFQTRGQNSDPEDSDSDEFPESFVDSAHHKSRQVESKQSLEEDSISTDRGVVQDSSEEDTDHYSSNGRSTPNLTSPGYKSSTSPVSYHQSSKSVEKIIRDLQEEASNLRRKNKLLEIRESRASNKLKDTESLLKQERAKVKQLSHDIEQLKRDIITLENENRSMGIHNQSLVFKNSAFIEYQMRSELYGHASEREHTKSPDKSSPKVDEQQAAVNAEDTPEGKRATRRMHCLKEMLSTERYYVEALNTLKDYFMVPMREQEILPDDVLRHIFDPVPTVISINSDLLEQLELIYDKYLESDQCELMRRLCRIMIAFEHRLKSYDRYICNYKIATSTLKRHMTPRLEQFLVNTSETLAQMKLRTTYIDAYLVQPIQRIPRYRMLLQELSKYVEPDDKDLQQLMASAIESSNTVATYCNAKQQEADIRDETMTALTEIDLLDEYSPDVTRVLMSIPTSACEIANKKFPGKIYLFDGFLVAHSLKKKKQTVVISFNDPSLVVRDKQERQVRYIFTEENGKESSLLLKFKVQDAPLVQKLNTMVQEQIEKHRNDSRLVRSSMRNIDGMGTARTAAGSSKLIQQGGSASQDVDDDFESSDSYDDGLEYQALLNSAVPNPFFVYQMAQHNQMRSMQQW